MSNYHYHDWFEIYYVISGKCHYYVEDAIYTLKENDIMFVSSCVPHKTIYQAGNTERVLLSFPKERIPASVLPAIKKKSLYYTPTLEEQQRLKKLFSLFEAEKCKKDLFTNELYNGYLTEILAVIFRGAQENETVQSPLRPIIEKVITYLNENYAQQITLSQVAELTSFTPSYFSVLFKQVTGIGFKEYLILIRLTNAQRMLKKTNKTISEIAYACGFNDSNYFSSQFAKYFEISPLQFRKQQHK